MDANTEANPYPQQRLYEVPGELPGCESGRVCRCDKLERASKEEEEGNARALFQCTG